MQGPHRVLARGLPGLGAPVDAAPAADDALHVGGGRGPADREQACLVLRRGDAGEGADLGVGEQAAAERVGQPR